MCVRLHLIIITQKMDTNKYIDNSSSPTCGGRYLRDLTITCFALRPDHATRWRNTARATCTRASCRTATCIAGLQTIILINIINNIINLFFFQKHIHIVLLCNIHTKITQRKVVLHSLVEFNICMICTQ